MDIVDRIHLQDSEVFQKGLQAAADRHNVNLHESTASPEALQERMDAVGLNLPPPVEIELEPRFFQEDIKDSLDEITSRLRGMRNDRSVPKEEFVQVKSFRARFMTIRSRVIAKGLTDEDFKIGNALLKEYAKYCADKMKA